MDIRNIQEKIGFKVNSLAVWADPTLAKLSAWGSWLSASAPYIQTPYEGILMSCKKQWKRLDSGTSTLTKEEFIESVGGIWKIQPETKQFTICNFPIELPRRCINLLSYENDIVLDPFMGSGTTACACLITKRNYIGFEISSNYTRIAEYRLKDYDKECGLKDLYEGE
jgi:site-specific DNA-methyltransferase (adenine-specific)